MNEGDKISEKILKNWKKNLSVPNYGPQDQKICKISAVHKRITLFYFGFKFFYCDTSSRYKFTDIGFLWLGVFFCGIMAKNRICPDLLKYFDLIFAIYPKIFLQLKKSYVSEQILLLLTFTEKWVTSTKFAEDMNRRVLKKHVLRKLLLKFTIYILS